MLINGKFDISCKLDISRNLSIFSSHLHWKASWSFATQSHGHEGGFCGLSPSETKLQVPPNSNKKHYETALFVQISENVKPHCTNVKPHYRGLSGDGSVATPRFSFAIPLVTVVRF